MRIEAMARQSFLAQTGDLHARQRTKEDTHVPRLSQSQATVLALWRLGMVLARACALTAVCTFPARWLGRQEQTVRPQLREFCYEAAAKQGG